jgi:uncharacterized membrane protein YedE/YeeE
MKISPFQQHLRFALLGTFMGFSLSHIGFSNFAELHKMFLFQDLRLLLTFAGGVAIAALVLNFFMSGLPSGTKVLHPGVIPGSAIFGAGWAISGSCPSIALVQVGEGQLAALFTLLGIAFGVWSYRQIHRRFFRWDSGTCG